MNILEYFYRLHPKRYKDLVEEKCEYANIDNEKNAFLSTAFLSVLIISAIAIFLPYSQNVKLGISFISVPIVYFSFPYILFSVAAERRRREMERVLPDALLLISTNIKSGSSISRAFLASSRDEFGPLEQELRKTAVEISSGKPVNEALDSLRYRINSEMFQDALKVLTDALDSGGNTADLLESSAEDIRNSLELRKEVSSSIRMYVIFIIMAAVFGAPLLFSITVYMSETTTQMWAQNDLSEGVGNFAQGGQSGLKFQQPSVNTEFLTQYSVLSLLITNTFASLIISQIRNGNIKEGAKYIPFTVITSIGIFLITQAVLGNVL